MKTYGKGEIGEIVKCEACGERPAHVRIKHAETVRHWRCIACFRSIVSGGVTVTGFATRGRIDVLVDVPLIREIGALRMLGKGREQ